MNSEHSPPPGLPQTPTFGRAKPAPKRNESKPSRPKIPRHMVTILAITLLFLLLGGLYFIHVTLGFKAAIESKVTVVYGPYPPFAMIFVVIPAFCGGYYFLLDFFRLKTDINPLASLPGLAACIGTGIILLFVSFLPVSLIKHRDNSFVVSHGYIRCYSLFDPHHVHVYALKDYVAAYGCPTAGPPQ